MGCNHGFNQTSQTQKLKLTFLLTQPTGKQRHSKKETGALKFQICCTFDKLFEIDINYGQANQILKLLLFSFYALWVLPSSL